MQLGRKIKQEESEVDDSHVTMKDLSKGIAIAQLFVDSLAQNDAHCLEDILKLKNGEWSGQPLTYLGKMFQNNLEKLLQSYNNSANSINYDMYSRIEKNCIEKRRRSSVPKIMSTLFTTSTSQSQSKYDSRSNEEINTTTSLGRTGPISPPSPNMNNREIIDNNQQKLSSPFDNQFSGSLEESKGQRSHSLSLENRFSDNLKGRLGHKELRNCSQSNDGQLSDPLKERLEYRKLRNPSPPLESRFTNNAKDRLDKRKPKYRSRRHSISQSRSRHCDRHQTQSSNNYSSSQFKNLKTENKSSKNPSLRKTRSRFKIRKDRKSEDRSMRPRSRKRSRSRDETNRASSYKSKKKSKCDGETKNSSQNQYEVQYVDENQYSSNGPPQLYQTPEIITGINSNVIIPTSQPVYRGPVPYYQPPQYGSTMVFYSHPSNGPPIRLQNMPPRGPPPYFMPPRPHFMGYAPPARHFYGPT